MPGCQQCGTGHLFNNCPNRGQQRNYQAGGAGRGHGMAVANQVSHDTFNNVPQLMAPGDHEGTQVWPQQQGNLNGHGGNL